MLFRAVLILVLGCIGVDAFAQHSDILLGYDDVSAPTELILQVDERTCEDIPFFDGTIVFLDPFNPADRNADDPGFASVVGAGMNPGDELWIEVLDASQYSQFGAGYMNLFDPSTGMITAEGQFALYDNKTASSDLIIDGDMLSGDNPQFIDVGNSGGAIHDHIVFDLLDEANAPVGAYAMLCRLQADFAPLDGEADIYSEPFWLIFDYDMEGDFETLALPAFGVIPGGATTEDIAADSYAVTRGQYVSGGTSELGASDNADFSARRNAADLTSRIFVELETTTSATDPLTLDFKLEASVFARSTVIQSIDLYNYTIDDWEEVDSRNAARFVDQTADVALSGDLSRFVEPGTGTLTSRIRFESVNRRQKFSANIDHVLWTVKY